MNAASTVFVLILLRIVVPIALMVLFSYFAHRMNQRWQELAARAPKKLIADEALPDATHSAHI